ncbi:uncharacterized protein Z518_00507 [Rhinocladiella mackenziei CBS 650.93]|uniref:Rhinocladiella mackenziei CBS 650.93 unplaced genomic scaffold supercont1.1, whole genome shotgun sequence n=1 Tax=Rhinocladiella mackenziei CBS 650.93 TaxID=1442369 RepID=A0A0D2G450_9EURO|nr:uncharacterized protein Z518_00507 [Rhinocladiella mackenziei CBS 650.93]KIX09427.1 hypothetical protein Z518_00507 [Rhinocladiella mackenziei CBS 650.93]
MTSEPRSDCSPVPNIRNACEECHNRKIRCNIPHEGGSCQSCQNNSRLCFFLPRNKSGRPKFTQPGGPQPKSSANAAAISSAVAAAIAKNEKMTLDSEPGSFSTSRPNTGSTQSPSSTPAPMYAIWPSPQQSQQQQQPPPQRQPAKPAMRRATTDSLERGFSDGFLDINGAPAFDVGDMDMSMSFSPTDFSQISSDASIFDQVPRSNGMQHRMHSASESSLDSLNGDPNGANSWMSALTSFANTPITIPGTPSSASDGNTLSKDSYSNLLGLTSRLQKCYETIQTGMIMGYVPSHCSKDQVESILKIVDDSCTAACKVLKTQYNAAVGSNTDTSVFLSLDPVPVPPTGSGSVNQSVIVLVVAMVLKIVEVCELLIQCGLPSTQSNLDNVLTFKRLEVNVLQTRIALNNILRVDQGLSHLTEDATKRIGAIQSKLGHIETESQFPPHYT